MHLFKVLLLQAATAALAAETPCQPGPDRQPTWACWLCGPNAEQFCQPYNATFDELVPGRPIGKYDNLTWTNFIAEDTRGIVPRDHLVPYSRCNYARLPAGQRGVMQDSVGDLILSFRYGCTTPWTEQGLVVREGTPTNCIISLTAQCSYSRASAMQQAFYFNYTVKPHFATPMTYTAGYGGFPYIGPGYGACGNYTWSAKSPSGGSVDLFLDDVIFKRVPVW